MAGTKSAKAPSTKQTKASAKKPKSTARRPKTIAAAPKAIRKRTAKAVAAAALLAAAPKKVGKVASLTRGQTTGQSAGKTTGKATVAVKPAAPYQPNTGAAAPLAKSPRAAAMSAFDPLALARPWMRLGFQMTMSNLATQARIAEAVLDLPPAAAAMRQGSAAYSAWLAMLDRAHPGKG